MSSTGGDGTCTVGVCCESGMLRVGGRGDGVCIDSGVFFVRLLRRTLVGSTFSLSIAFA